MGSIRRGTEKGPLAELAAFEPEGRRGQRGTDWDWPLWVRLEGGRGQLDSPGALSGLARPRHLPLLLETWPRTHLSSSCNTRREGGKSCLMST